MNRFIIEEDGQSECVGVVDLSEFPIIHCRKILEKIVELSWSETSLLHIFLSVKIPFFESATGIIDSIRTSPSEIMITRIASERLQCVKKEQYETFYREGGEIRIKTPEHPLYIIPSSKITHKIKLLKSIGDDIEDFYNYIQKNEINLIPIGFSRLELELDFPDCSIGTFHLSLLTEQTESEMYSRSEFITPHLAYGKFDYFKHETILRKKEQNYALSFCTRQSFFLTHKNSDHLYNSPPNKRSRSQLRYLYKIEDPSTKSELLTFLALPELPYRS